jgi:hypothetical protein
MRTYGRAALTLSWYAAIVFTALAAIGVELDREGRFDSLIAAIVPELFQGDALENQTRRAFQRNDLVQGEALARRLVERRPIPAEGLSLYADALLANGKEQTGEVALQIAAGRGWRDPFVQRVVILSALQQGTLDIAANRVIALWRLGERGTWVLGLTKATLEAPGGLSAFERALIDRERKWGFDFLSWAAGNLSFEIVDRLAKQMAEHHSEFDCARFSGKIDSLVHGGSVKPAAAVWEGFCAKGHAADTNDLGFTLAEIVPGPFDWRYLENPGVDVALLHDRENVVLHYSSSDPLLHVIARRYLALSPGTHLLSFKEAAMSSGAQWRVACVGRQSNTEVRLKASPEGQLSFNVPDQCPVQELSIAARSGSGDIERVDLR